MFNIHNQLEKIIDNLTIDKNISQEKLENAITEALDEIMPEICDEILLSILSESKDKLAQQRIESEQFIESNYNKWEAGFNALETFIMICTAAGSHVNDTYRANAAAEENIKFDVLTRLHARACHISSEILWLIKGGYPDAANSRWRALHEVVVTASFLQDNEVDLSIRYLAHEAIESYRAAIQYNRYQSRLNTAKLSEGEIEDRKKDYDECIRLYGKSFKESYGWASHALDNPKPNFSNIEEAVELDHFRPYYKWASQNIHASVLGIQNQLGLAKTEDDILLAGPSDSGMTDPAELASISLSLISITLLSINSTVDSMILQKIILKYSKEIVTPFLKIEEALTS